MKSVLRKIAAMTALGLSSLTVQAVSYTDTHTFGLPGVGILMDGASTEISGTFNIGLHGYNPAAETITSATAWFFFKDNMDTGGPFGSDNASEQVAIDLGGLLFQSASEVEAFTVLGGMVSLSAQLQSTGMIDYKIARTEGDFYALGASFTADTVARRSVPDGGSSVGLMGLALIGLGCLRKKLKAA